MNPADYHVSANNPGIDHLGPRETCQFGDCIFRRVRYEVLAETETPLADVARFRTWLTTATEAERHAADLVAQEQNQHWALTVLDLIQKGSRW